jgi:hypothetical protein
MTELILTIAAIYVLRLTIASDVRRGTWCLLLCLLALTACWADWPFGSIFSSCPVTP